jgi:hypothetical protein
MRIVFKINLEDSKIPKYIQVPKTLIEGKFLKNKLPNFVEKEFLDKEFNFDYDKEKKILTSIDEYPKVIHGIYSQLNLKLIKKGEEGIYTHGWFTGFEGRFVGHDILFRHFVTFDEITFTLINKVAYFFRKDGKTNFTSPGKELDSEWSGAYVWLNKIN